LDFILRGRALRGDGGGKTENIGKNAQSPHMMRNLKKAEVTVSDMVFTHRMICFSML
jgi:hypothetical protein